MPNKYELALTCEQTITTKDREKQNHIRTHTQRDGREDGLTEGRGDKMTDEETGGRKEGWRKEVKSQKERRPVVIERREGEEQSV